MVTGQFGMDVVGRKPSTNPTPMATPPAGSEVDPKKLSDMMSRLNIRLKDKGITIAEEGLTGLSMVDSLSPAQLTSIGKILKKKGYSVKASEADIKRILADDPILIGLAEQSSNYDELAKLMMADYLPGLDTPKEPNLPSRQIYQYRDEDIDAIVNDAYKAAVMREPTPAELEAQRVSARKKLEMGTLSTTTKVKNKKTGKLENVTVQTPGASKTEVQTGIEKTLEEMNPDEADRKNRIDFSSWLSKNAAGA
jgi:hypothetical protein